MGEVTRQIIKKLVSDGLMFGGRAWKQLDQKDRFYGKYISEIVSTTLAEADGKSSFFKVRQVLGDFGAENPSPEDCANIARVCTTVVKRSAHLCAAGIAALLNRMQKPRVTVGIDGSVYRFNQPYFHDWMRDRVMELLEVQCEFKLKLSSDGSGRGAALVAAVAARLKAEGRSAEGKSWGCEVS